MGLREPGAVGHVMVMDRKEMTSRTELDMGTRL